MTQLSQKHGKTLPWKTVKDVIGGSLHARFTELTDESGQWPCEVHQAKSVNLKVATSSPELVKEGGGRYVIARAATLLVGSTELEPSEVMDLGDAMPRILEIKAKSNAPIRFHLRVEVGDGQELPAQEMADEVNAVLKEVKEGFQVQ